MHVTAIIAAAGSGRRVGSAKPKQMLDIGGGSMLQHSVKAFLTHPRITEVIVVVPPGPSALVLADVDPARVPADARRHRRRAPAGFRGQRVRRRGRRRPTWS